MRSTPATAGRASNGSMTPGTSGCIVTIVSTDTLAARRPAPKRGFFCNFAIIRSSSNSSDNFPFHLFEHLVTDQLDLALFVALLLSVCSLQDFAQPLLPNVTLREDIVCE